MNTKLLLLAACMLSAAELLGQNDSTKYRFGLPVSEDDTARHFPPTDFAPETRIQVVPASELPEEVLEALTTEEQYEGWRDTLVYFEKNTGLYRVPVKRKDGIRIFGLNKRGKPVTFDIVTQAPE